MKALLPLKKSLGYTVKLIASHPEILMPAILAIFFTTIAIHSILIAAFVSLFGTLKNLRLDLVLLELFISIAVGIFLHAFYVSLAKSYSSGTFSMKRAASDLNRHKAQIGILGIFIHIINLVLIAVIGLSIYFIHLHYGLYSPAGLGLAALGIVAFLAFVYANILFFEVNVAIIIEGKAGAKALSRSIAMARENLFAMSSAVILVGTIYLLVYAAINTLSHDSIGVWRLAFAYISLVPYAIATVIYDLMAPAIYYKQIKFHEKKWHARHADRVNPLGDKL